ncbi:hypothetical protein [Breoghania sp.]|uniref:hypothetical protein n=1 Tax=Breoghania sp. TaxID=2065378 RepID=UPI002AAAC360|nr:hypothetical protein [Breoghania sp.]
MSSTRKPLVGKTGGGSKSRVKIASPVDNKFLNCTSGLLRQAVWYPDFAAPVDGREARSMCERTGVADYATRFTTVIFLELQRDDEVLIPRRKERCQTE